MIQVIKPSICVACQNTVKFDMPYVTVIRHVTLDWRKTALNQRVMVNSGLEENYCLGLQNQKISSDFALTLARKKSKKEFNSSLYSFFLAWIIGAETVSSLDKLHDK